MVHVVDRDFRDEMGEGPLWCERLNALYWTDIFGCRLNRLNLSIATVDSWKMPGQIGWVIERDLGGLIAGIGRSIVGLDRDGRDLGTIARIDPAPGGIRLNDAKADPEGRIWAGSMPLGSDEPTGALHRLDPNGDLTRVDDGYRIANGPAISSDGRVLLHTDSALRTIYRFAINDDGSLGPRAVHIEFEQEWGLPDGMTFDAEGGLWVACWGAGRIIRFTDKGKQDRSIEFPTSQITSCTFAGPRLDRMFVTSAAVGVDEELAGALFEIDPGVKGCASSRFGG